MKKLLLLFTALVLSVGLYAQDTDVNRLIVHKNDRSTQGFVLDRVDSLTFATVNGEVAADIELLSFDLDKISVKVTRTEMCMGYKFAIVPSIQIASMSDDYLPTYIDKKESYIYYQDFDKAEMTDLELEEGTDYTILTVGIDMYEVLCDVRKVEFTTEGGEVVGDPYVTMEVVDCDLYEYSVKFTPNEYVSKYSVLSVEFGTLQSQYEMFAPMFQWANMGDMIEGWGKQYEAEATHTWKDVAPNTKYEVVVQAWDKDGNRVPTHQSTDLTTLSLGGDGVAEVEITIGEYKLADWGGEMLPSQFITFTPNDQTSAYRMMVYLAEEYNPEAEAIKQELCSDPDSDIPVAGWYHYETMTTDYQINPSTDCVAIAAAKNSAGEWGPVKEVRFTTPSKMPTSSPSNIIKERENNIENVKGKAPFIKQTSRLKSVSK